MESKVNRREQPRTDDRADVKTSARTRILDVAIELILDFGVEALTFERLAEKTGLSKGGVLHHFPTRDELYLAVREIVRERYQAARAETIDALPDTPSRELKSWIIAGLNNRSQLDAVSAKIMTSGLWASKDDSARYAERFQNVARGVGFNRAAVAYLATEGLWFLELAKFSPFSALQREQIVEMLLELADGADVPD
jgi:AcrR family transcriptional regulator